MSKFKKIIFLVLNLGSQGGSRVVIDIANFLVNKNIDVTILTSNVDNHPYFLDRRVKIKSFPNSSNKYLNYITYIFYSFFIIRKKDLVISTFFITFYIAYAKSYFTKINHYYFVQGIDSIRHGIFGKIFNIFCDKSYNYTKVITSNSSIANNLKSKNKTIYEEINIGPRKIFYENNTNVKSKNFDIIYFARNEKYKRLDRFESFLKNQYSKKLKIIVVSQDKDLLKKLKLNFDFINISVPKNDFDLISIIDQSKCLFYTSDYEGFGLPIYECLARKVPFIAYKISAFKHFEATDIKNFLIQNNDDAIVKFKKILIDKNYRERIANLGYNFCLKYNMEYSAQKFIKAINI